MKPAASTLSAKSGKEKVIALLSVATLSLLWLCGGADHLSSSGSSLPPGTDHSSIEGPPSSLPPAATSSSAVLPRRLTATGNTDDDRSAGMLPTTRDILAPWFTPDIVRAGKCNGSRAFSPTIAEEVGFFRSHPTYPPFAVHSEKMKRALVAMEQAVSETERNRYAAELVDLVEQLLAMPRQNPGITAEDPRWGRRVLPLQTVLLYLRCVEKHGLKVLRWPVPPSSCLGNRTKYLHFFRKAVDVQHFLAFERLQRSPAASVFRDRRAGFTPQLFLDLGARDHDPSTRRLSVDRPAVKYVRGSVAWMVKHYPGFDAIPTLAFEIDGQYASSYKTEYARRAAARVAGKQVAPFRLHTAGAWVHSEGMGLKLSDMVNVNDACTEGNHCRCVPTVDVTELLRQMPRRSVTMKIDIELFEWVVLAEWAKEGVLDRIGEMFLECHTTSKLKPEQRVFGHPQYNNDTGPSLWSLFVGPMDCVYLEDFVRSYGVATHSWP